MTLPKNITDAIDAYRRECLDDNRWEHDHKQAVDDSRAALEAAIADHIADAGKKVEPPTDTAEAMRIVAELHRMRCVLMLTDERVRDDVNDEPNTMTWTEKLGVVVVALAVLACCYLSTVFE